MRITETESEIRKNRMLLTAYRLFCEYGIDNVSMAKIAKAANVSPNSIFRYFDSKASLIEQTQNILWDKIVECISKNNQLQITNEDSGLEEIRVLLYGFQNLYQNHREYVLFAYDYKAFLMRNHIILPADAFMRTVRNIEEVFICAMKRGQQDGSISAHLCPLKQFMTTWGILRSFVEQLVVHSQIYDGNNPWEIFFPNIIDYLINDLKPKGD